MYIATTTKPSHTKAFQAVNVHGNYRPATPALVWVTVSVTFQKRKPSLD